MEVISEELKTTKQDYIHKCNGRSFREEKIYKIINITIAESAENVWHVTRQNVHSVHVPYIKNKN